MTVHYTARKNTFCSCQKVIERPPFVHLLVSFMLLLDFSNRCKSPSFVNLLCDKKAYKWPTFTPFYFAKFKQNMIFRSTFTESKSDLLHLSHILYTTFLHFSLSQNVKYFNITPSPHLNRLHENLQ